MTKYLKSFLSLVSVLPALAAVLWAQAPAPKFAAVSVRPCNAGETVSPGSSRGGSAGKINWSPGRVSAGCQTVESLIRDAYLRYADGKPLPVLMPGRRVPSISDRMLGQPIKACWRQHFWINSAIDTPSRRKTTVCRAKKWQGGR